MTTMDEPEEPHFCYCLYPCSWTPHDRRIAGIATMTIGAFFLTLAAFALDEDQPTLDENPSTKTIINASMGLFNVVFGLSLFVIPAYRTLNLPIWKLWLSGTCFSGGAGGISALVKVTGTWRVLTCIIWGFIFGLAFFDAMIRYERRERQRKRNPRDIEQSWPYLEATDR